MLREAVEQNSDAFRFDEINAIQSWPKVVGEAVARKTSRPFIRNGVMTVRVLSAPLRQELNMLRSSLAEAINREIGKEIVKELYFRG